MNARIRTLGGPAALALVAALSLSACGGDSLKDSLGYGKNAPDEFAIVTKAPLVIPPDFSLRPPQPGAPRPQEEEFQPNVVAERALTGTSGLGVGTAGATTGEEILLAKTGADTANPKIRQVVNNESRSLVEKDKTFTEEVLFWQQPTDPDARTVDAVAERRRIQENQAQGKPVTEGETPYVEPEKPGFFSGLWSSVF
jgi:hypothetical protein